MAGGRLGFMATGRRSRVPPRAPWLGQTSPGSQLAEHTFMTVP